MAIISATSAIDRTILVLFWLSAVLVINLPSHGGSIGYRLDMSKVARWVPISILTRSRRAHGAAGVANDSAH